jgi:hypothetical protein
MAKIVIKARPEYVKRLYLHLRKEHPSTRRKMKMVGVKK